MKKITSAAVLTLIMYSVHGQNYPNILNYAFNNTPAHGVKIRTNLPFANGSQMPTISIVGYSYRNNSVIDLKLVYYIYNENFYYPTISSAGNYAPKVYLAKENGKVVIFIDDKVYFQRFTVGAFAYGMSEIPAWFQGWATADEPLNGTNIIELPYGNKFGDINFVNGSVGIGTEAPQERLSVNGKVRAKEVKVEVANWPDYVFDSSYNLLPLQQLRDFIKTNKHLPAVPSAKEVQEEGVDLGRNQAILLKKIEEMTLHLIDMDIMIKELRKENQEIKNRLGKFKSL